ncbi:MAG: ATP-dependent helicase HrpB [Desulfuromonadales bacterium]|nr:ATP-dependent helicase HrpB [Desulfuromonadales bacterium]
MHPDVPSLPVETVLPELSVALAEHGSAVLVAPTGSGKTTRVPLALLDAPWLQGQGIVLLEPRRLAATNVARYMAGLRGEAAGGTVGYAIRYERCVSKRTRLEVVTEGILTRRLQADPELAGVGLVILDEFHERSLNADLALALCRDAQRGLRPELRLLVMSATLDAQAVAGLLGNAPVICCSGRSFPVDVRYLPRDPDGPLVVTVTEGVRRAVKETAGDILAFLPGSGEIRRCVGQLAGLGDVDIRPLYGELPFDAQERAILPGARRRVVLATNIAETSLTIEGIGAVVDSGFERRPRFDPVTGSTQLELVRISRSSAEQRAGRAGRLGPGSCIRLWCEGTHGALLPSTPPEIRQADLMPLALDLARWGVTDANELSWLDPPPAGALNSARELLQQLGSLDERLRLTATGEEAAGLPLHPRLACLLLAARAAGQLSLGCDLVALLGERDLCPPDWRPPHASASDLCGRLEILQRGRGEQARLTAVRRAAVFWRKRFGVGEERSLPAAAVVNRLLAVAFPDRIAVRREPGGERYLLASGRGARLGARSAVPRPDFLVAADLRGTSDGEVEITLAGSLDRSDLEELFVDRLHWRREIVWDEAAGRVVGHEVRSIGAVVLQERPIAVTPEETLPLLLDILRRDGLATLSWTPAAEQLRARLAFLHGALPEEGWPEVSDAALLANLDTWLTPWLVAVRGRGDLAKLDLTVILQSWLGGKVRELERLAPERLAVPSGSRVRLGYAVGTIPVLAAKLQELFGMADTPRIAGGRVPVLIHLLSPAGRPLAVTQDLRSFWDKVYPEVRKEMRGRYPKHPWPDDPWSAPATRRTK